jgi:hypothetical protein
VRVEGLDGWRFLFLALMVYVRKMSLLGYATVKGRIGERIGGEV